MLHFPRWKVWGIVLICLVTVLLAVPSFLPNPAFQHLPTWAQNIRVNLGLDLAGGSHLMLEAQTGDVARLRLEAIEDTMRREMRRARIQIADVSTSGGQLSFAVRDSAQVERARGIVSEQTTPTFGGQRDWEVGVTGNRFVLRPTQAGLDKAVDNAMDVAREIIDRRINALGTLEPTILRQGSNRIVVQVPGLQDPEALKALIGRTARLEFKMVNQNVTPEQLQSGRAPIGSQLLPTAEGGRIAVERRAIITGDMIANARQDFDSQDGTPNVILSFDTTGSQRFARTTQENVGRPFAIILDNVVISYPNIREPILGGQASISGGGFTVESANQLAISLRSGRLPVELHVVEERTVGPDLGRDSIQKGVIASIVATLTLPGIAGFVLTIGAAVDANVLINERIREEQRKGKRLLDSLESGYREASTAIFDANITNVIAAVLMYYFGSGPIRGFAVVLMIGIVTSVFTAVNITRMLTALWVRRARPKELHI